MRTRRAILIPVILLLAAFVVMSLALLSKQSLQYASGIRVASMAKSRSLAQAGMDDFRSKYSSDINFPPPLPDGAQQFSYLEAVKDIDGATIVGYFRVKVDTSWRNHRYSVLKVTSEGLVGSPELPEAFYTIQGMLDISLVGREGQPVNPDLGQWIEWRESN